MNLFDCIQALIAVADKGSVQKAAHTLAQTPAAISRKITKLENHLGVQLVKREKSGAVLTRLGQHYYHQCKQGVAYIDAANQLSRVAKEEPCGILKVTISDYYLQHTILPRLQAFKKRYPKIDCYFNVVEIIPHFKDVDIDILFGVSIQGDDNLMQKRIDQWRHLLCVSPLYLQKQPLPKTPAELLQHNFIAHTARKPNNIIYLNEVEALKIKPTFYFNQTASIIAAALAGLGIIWVPEPFVKAHIDSGALIEIMPQHHVNTIPAYVFYRQQKIPSPKVRAFIDFFTA